MYSSRVRFYRRDRWDTYPLLLIVSHVWIIPRGYSGLLGTALWYKSSLLRSSMVQYYYANWLT